VPAGMDQRSEEMTTENVEHDMSQMAASRAQCSKSLAAAWTLDDNSLVGELALQLPYSFHCSVLQYLFKCKFLLFAIFCKQNTKFGSRMIQMICSLDL